MAAAPTPTEPCLADAAVRDHIRPREANMWFGQQTAPWRKFATMARGLAADEARLRRQFWRKLKSEAASIPFLETLLTGYYCAFDQRTPFYAKALLTGALAYFVMPKRLLPKQLILIGLADDAAILAAACKAISNHIKPEHREAAQRALTRLRGATQSA